MSKCFVELPVAVRLFAFLPNLQVGLEIDIAKKNDPSTRSSQNKRVTLLLDELAVVPIAPEDVVASVIQAVSDYQSSVHIDREVNIRGQYLQTDYIQRVRQLVPLVDNGIRKAHRNISCWVLSWGEKKKKRVHLATDRINDRQFSKGRGYILSS